MHDANRLWVEMEDKKVWEAKNGKEDLREETEREVVESEAMRQSDGKLYNR